MSWFALSDKAKRAIVQYAHISNEIWKDQSSLWYFEIFNHWKLVRFSVNMMVCSFVASIQAAFIQAQFK